MLRIPNKIFRVWKFRITFMKLVFHLKRFKLKEFSVHD